MRKEAAIAACTFGWGQEFKLYQYHLDVGSTTYALKDLTSIHSSYQRVMGIPSLRLELRFGKKKVILRGIAAIEEGQKVIDFLTTSYLPPEQLKRSVPQSESGSGWSRSRAVEAHLQPAPGPSTTALGHHPLLQPDDSLAKLAQADTAKVETTLPNWQRFRQEQRERREKRLHIERSLHEHGFDVDMLAQHLKQENLPTVAVPVRLLAAEQAYYSAEVTHCDEPPGDTTRFTYPAKDHGTLILTNKRMIYMGRKSQIVLAYARLLHVSRLRGAIAFQAEHWYKREIFEMPRPLECAMHLERILEQFQQESLAFEQPSTQHVGTPAATPATSTHNYQHVRDDDKSDGQLAGRSAYSENWRKAEVIDGPADW